MNGPKIVSKSVFFSQIDKKLKKLILRSAKKYDATEIISINYPKGKNEVIFAGPGLQWETWIDVKKDNPEYIIERVCIV